MVSYVAHEQVGYFRKDVRVHVDKRLEYCPYGQCGVKFTRDGILLYSYSSLIARAWSGGIEWGFDVLPDYSRTTIRHFQAFCKEYANWYSYYQWKCDHYNANVTTAWKD